MAESSTCREIDVTDLAQQVSINLQDLEKECRHEHLLEFAELCVEWELIAHHLRPALSQAQISAIKEDYPSAEMRRIKMLQKWKECALRCTYRVLIEAFLKCKKAQQASIICKRVKDCLVAISDNEDRCEQNLERLPTQDDCAAANVQNASKRGIREKLNDLDRHFSRVQMQLINTGGLTLQRLKQCLSTLPSFTSESSMQLLHSSSIEEFFHYLKQYCNALCPQILVDLIEHVGDEKAKQEMSRFNIKCEAFRKETKLKDMIGNYEGPTSVPLNYNELEIKLGDRWRERTLEDLESLQYRLSLQHRLLKIISEGSVIVSYLVPITLNLRFKDLVSYLQEQEVIEITLEKKCIFKAFVKFGQIMDCDRLFSNIAVDIHDKYMEIGIELGLEGKVLRDELETGSMQMQQGSKKALKMLQLWKASVHQDKCTYSTLAAALKKHQSKECAYKHCYTNEVIPNVDDPFPNKEQDTDKPCPPSVDSSRDKLLHALRMGHMDVAEQLMEEDGRSSRNKLHHASRIGDLDEVKRLVEEENVDPSETALQVAVQSGSLDVTRYFIEKQSVDPDCRGPYEITLLHIAVAKNQFQVVDYLITKQQLDPWCRDKENGLTPLHTACMCGYVELIRYLIDVMSKLTPLMNVLYCRTKLQDTPLHNAAMFGHLKVVQLLISEYNVDPNTRGVLGRLPLHHAAQKGFLDVAKYLIEEMNCDPSCYDENKSTPLNLAATFGQPEVVKYLTLDKGCSPLEGNYLGHIPLHNSAAHGHLDLVDFFISQLKVNPGIPSPAGETPLHLAVQEGHLDIAKYLIEKQHCNPSCVDEKKRSPLHLASAKGHLHIVAYLIKEQHCNPFCYDKVVGTPFHYAACFGQLFVIKYFVEDLKCPINNQGAKNTTALEIARALGHTDVVEYLMSVN